MDRNLEHSNVRHLPLLPLRRRHLHHLPHPLSHHRRSSPVEAVQAYSKAPWVEVASLAQSVATLEDGLSLVE